MSQNDSRKYSVVSAVIATICIAIYLAALVWAAVHVYTSIERRRLIAEQEFFDLADTAVSAGVLGFMDEAFIRTIQDALARTITLEGLIISGPNGEYAFEKVPGEAIYWVNSSPRFKNRFDFSRDALHLPLRIQGLRNVNIQAVAGALDYELLSNILKRTLIFILAALMLAFFTLLVESLRGGGKKRYFQSKQDDETEPPVQPFSFEAESDIAEPETPPPAEYVPVEDVPVTETQGADSPQGLYSPRSNTGWEDYTAERLNSELHFCITGEQDMVLIMMGPKLEIDDNTYNRLAADTVRFFTRREHIFEKGKQGLTVICPGIDLEKGFAASEDFHSRIVNKYSLSRRDFCMGLTSRSGRIVDAQRLMFEASEALERALLDPESPIVAFKSDPEKYRAFISRKTTV
ncbi:MAG: hypothetical protein LBH97_06210 [Treponema sp.]|jgi:hypothetical protein|nr:hypothetical protein [Treponema sp.]